MEKNLTCNHCKHEISLTEDEWNRHRTFWRSNTNILKRSFICDSCLAQLRSGNRPIEKEQTPSSLIIPDSFKQEFETIWKRYYSIYKRGEVSEESVNQFKIDLNKLLVREGVEQACSISFDIETKPNGNGKVLAFPADIKEVKIKLPFISEPIFLEIKSETTYFE